MIEKLIGARKTRQCYRFIRHFKVTFLCLLLTILVLRGTIGAGKFGTPEQDFIKIRNRFASRKLSQPHQKNQFDYNALSDDNVDGLGSISLSNYSLGSKVVVWDKMRENLRRYRYYSSKFGDNVDSLGPKVVKWDKKREKWVRNRSHLVKFGDRMRKPRVLVVTGSSENPCESPVGDRLLLKSIENKIGYCRLHEMEIFHNMALLEAEMNGFWSKLGLIRNLLVGHPEIEFLWWMDSDALFTNMSFKVPWERYEGYNLVIHGWNDRVFEDKNWVGLNTGSFLIRNCRLSLDMLDLWVVMGARGKTLTNELKDRPQSEMVYFLAKEKDKWGSKVYFENGEMMKNYHLGFDDHGWPFVTHFLGCKPCVKARDYLLEKCLKQMERAFDCVGNQVIRLYGYAHTSLDSEMAQRIHNETSS